MEVPGIKPVRVMITSPFLAVLGLARHPPGSTRPCEVTIAKHQGLYGQDGDGGDGGGNSASGLGIVSI